MQIKWIVFEELTSNSGVQGNRPRLREQVRETPQINEEEIVQYLDSAPVFCALMRVVGDVLDPNAKVVLFPGSRSDGVYAWPAELAYYVRRYHVRVPQEVVDRMKSLDWVPPSEESIDWDHLDFESQKSPIN